VLLADDHSSILERLISLLERDFDIVGTAVDGRDLVAAALRLQPAVIVLDISMPGLNGIEAARELKASGSSAKLVFLTVHENTEFVHACLAEGGLGYVAKSRMAVDLLPAVRDACCGRRFISPSTSRYPAFQS